MGGLNGFVGGMRNGKTGLMVDDTLRDYLNGRRTKSNLLLTFPFTKNYEAETGVKLFKPQQFHLLDLMRYLDNEADWHNIVLDWDEIYINLEARLSGGNEVNRIGSYFAMQSGKADVTINWTSQRFGNLDNRIRWATVEVGTITKVIGTFVFCPHFGYVIKADYCRTYQSKGYPCPNSELCQKTQDYYVRYKKWSGRRWKSYTRHNLQRVFKLYKTADVISYNETIMVAQYLRQRKTNVAKQIRDAMKELEKNMPTPEQDRINDFIAELSDIATGNTNTDSDEPIDEETTTL